MLPDARLSEAAHLLASTEASDIMVADDEGILVGVLSEGDIIRAVLPDVEEIRSAGGSVHDALRAFERKASTLAGATITRLVITNPLTIAPDDHLAAVAAVMIANQIRRLPVVEDGRLVGTVSRSDVCRVLLR